MLFDKDDRLGGLLRYGIPDFKLEKHYIDRRLEQMVAEGVKFEPGVNVGVDISGANCAASSTPSACAWARASPASCLCPAPICAGVHFAMDFLTQQNRRVAGDLHAATTSRRRPKENT